MKLNIRAIAIALALTAILAIFGIYVGLIAIIAPLIGGFVAAYAYTNNTGDGALNAGIGAGIGGLIYTILAIAVLNSVVTSYTILVPTGANYAVTIIGALIIDFILGAIAGVAGALAKGESSAEAQV